MAIEFIKTHWRDAVEILILAVCIYQIYRTIRATRGAQILVGLAMIFVALTLISAVLKFEVIAWIITQGAKLLAFALVVIFQPELRNGLARLGSKKLFQFSNRHKIDFIERFADSVVALSKKRIGALFAFQQSISLEDQLETGVLLDAKFTPELAMAVFHPKAPLHDGGMIIVEDRVAGAACVFPVTEKEMQDRSTGLRHRAAIGLTEHTDAIAIVVSEETGGISISENGNLHRNLTDAQFREMLSELLVSGKKPDETTPAPEQLDRKADVADSSDRDLVSD